MREGGQVALLQGEVATSAEIRELGTGASRPAEWLWLWDHRLVTSALQAGFLCGSCCSLLP